MHIIRTLNINNYKTHIILGNNEHEKHKKRPVTINISLRFLENVPACFSDKLEETVCYYSLLTFIEKKFETQNFCLVEHAAQQLFDALAVHINKSSSEIKVLKKIEIVKVSPGPDDLESASFVISEW